MEKFRKVSPAPQPSLLSRTLASARTSLAKFISPDVVKQQKQVYDPGQDSRGVRASSGRGYEGAGHGRRGYGWVGSRLGPTTLLLSSIEELRARSWEQVRDNGYARSAFRNFRSEVIGNGIRPSWDADEADKKAIETAWRQWAESTDCDPLGQMNFYALQALLAGEIYVGGEAFGHHRVYSTADGAGLKVPYQVEILPSEQLPIWRNVLNNGDGTTTQAEPGSSIRVGIEFNKAGRKTAYHFFKQNPGETMFFPLEGTQYQRIPASEIMHCYEVDRCGQLRGEPHMAPVLTLLYEIDQYTDASLVKKKIQQMFSFFVEKVDLTAKTIPSTVDATDAPNDPNTPIPASPPPGVENIVLEPGTIQYLQSGEKMTVPNLPAESDFEMFMKVQLHKLAQGLGYTSYEQLCGDLEKVNLSSIRVGLLNVRRKIEQFQRNVMISQFCQRVAVRFVKEAVFAGVLKLKNYSKDPSQYEKITWAPAGWPWIDPQKDADAALTSIRMGATSLERVVAERGDDIAVVMNQIAADNKRADGLGLVLDSDPRKILIGRESNPQADEEGAPTAVPSKSGVIKPAAPPTPAPKPKNK
jgi:lambda family phage portal protein